MLGEIGAVDVEFGIDDVLVELVLDEVLADVVVEGRTVVVVVTGSNGCSGRLDDVVARGTLVLDEARLIVVVVVVVDLRTEEVVAGTVVVTTGSSGWSGRLDVVVVVVVVVVEVVAGGDVVVVVRPGQSGQSSNAWLALAHRSSRDASLSGAAGPAAGTVTEVLWGDAVRVVCALPTASVIENDPAAVKVDVTAAPPADAVEVAVTVQIVDEVCAIEEMAEMPVNVKSVPSVTDNVVQSNASSPVIVNVMVAVDDVAAEAASVTVGAVASRVMVVVAAVADAGPMLPTASATCAAFRRGMMVPDEQLATVMVRLVPVAALGEKEQPVAVPVFSKSPAASPVMLSDIVSVYEKLVDREGVVSDEVKDDTDGLAPSSGIADALAVDVFVVESLNVAVTVNV